MPEITQTRQRAADLQKRINFASLERAYGEGMNFSRWLEKEDPSKEYNDGLDAFERQLAVGGITTRSNPERGFYADEFRKFEELGEAGRVLQVEYLSRQYRKTAHAARAIIASDAATVGSAMRPYVEAAQVRMNQIAPAIPISELIALQTRIDNDAYRALYLNDDEQEFRMVRVGETAEIPGARLTQGARTVDLFKYARRLDISYEAMRRMPIDTIAFWIARMAIQAEVDKVSTVQHVLINGDGNSGTAAKVVTLGELDAAATTANVLTLKAWLAFKLQFKNPYALTHELVRDDIVLQQMLLDTGSANIPILSLTGGAAFGGFTPMNPALGDNVRYGTTDDAPANKILAFDARFAIEQITEIGGTINETKKWVEKQVDSLVFSEVEGYAVIDSNAAKILDLTVPAV